MNSIRKAAVLAGLLMTCVILSSCGNTLEKPSSISDTEARDKAVEESSSTVAPMEINHAVVLAPQPKSVAISTSYVAMLQEDGTVRVMLSQWESDEINAELLTQQVESWSDVIQIIAQNSIGGQDLFGLKRDGTILYTNLQNRDAYESTFSQWEDVSNLYLGSADEILGLTADGRLYYTDSHAQGGTVVTKENGFVAAVASHNGHLYAFFEDGKFGTVRLEDGSFLPYDMEDAENFLTQTYGVWYEDYKKVQSAHTLPELKEAMDSAADNFHIMSAVLPSLLNYREIASIPDLRLKALCEFSEFPILDMILTADGDVFYFATPLNMGSAQNFTPEEFMGGDFVQIVLDENVGSALRSDGTVAVFTGKEPNEDEEDFFLTARNWTNIVSIYAENDVLCGITADGQLLVADGNWLRHRTDQAWDKLVAEEIEAQGWGPLYTGKN